MVRCVPFSICTPAPFRGTFPQVASHWHESMELVFVKQGSGLVQVGCDATRRAGGISLFLPPGTLHALRQAAGQCMEYENIIFELELLGGAEDLCAEKYLLPLQSGRLSLPRLTPKRFVLSAGRRLPAGAGGCQPRQAPRATSCVKGALLRFLALLIASTGTRAPRRYCRHPAAENASCNGSRPIMHRRSG